MKEEGFYVIPLSETGLKRSQEKYIAPKINLLAEPELIPTAAKKDILKRNPEAKINEERDLSFIIRQ